MPATDRRQYQRLPLDVPFTLLIPGHDKPISGRLHDISQGGCFFTTSDGVLDRTRRISVDFVVLPRSICNATGRVVRHANNESGYGIEFGAINPELQQFVAELGSAPEERRAEYVARILDPEIHVA